MTTLPSDAVLKELRAFGLSYPGAHTKSPWPDHVDLAVDDKTFAYLSVEGEPLSISCKLPETNETALLMPYAEPTAYGLGNSGWVTAKFPAEDMPPVDVLKVWLDESYRAQAPKRRLATLAAHGGVAAKLAQDAAKQAALTDKAEKDEKIEKAAKATTNGKAKTDDKRPRALKTAPTKSAKNGKAAVASHVTPENKENKSPAATSGKTAAAKRGGKAAVETVAASSGKNGKAAKQVKETKPVKEAKNAKAAKSSKAAVASKPAKGKLSKDKPAKGKPAKKSGKRA